MVYGPTSVNADGEPYHFWPANIRVVCIQHKEELYADLETLFKWLLERYDIREYFVLNVYMSQGPVPSCRHTYFLHQEWCKLCHWERRAVYTCDKIWREHDYLFHVRRHVAISLVHYLTAEWINIHGIPLPSDKYTIKWED